MERGVVKFFVGATVLILIFIFIHLTQSSGEDNIKEWAKENNFEIKNIETNMTSIGSPFYYTHKSGFIYKIELKNGDVWWMRQGTLFFNDELVKE